MDVPFELHIALRYLLAKRKQAFISVISLISTLGVTVGVMALVIALALMTGLQQELRDRILGVEPAHLRLEDAAASPTTSAEAEKLRQVPRRGRRGARRFSARRWSRRPAARRSSPLKGIDPALEPSVTDIGGAMRSGSARRRSSDAA